MNKEYVYYAVSMTIDGEEIRKLFRHKASVTQFLKDFLQERDATEFNVRQISQIHEPQSILRFSEDA